MFKIFSRLNKKIIFDLLIIILLGLTPLLWFRGNEIILGHDAGLTLSPVSHFIDRLYPWTERFGFGNDQTYAIAGFFIHGLEALITFLGFDIQANQKIVFIFWFMLPGLTMYYFASSLSKKLNLKYLALPAAVFYMFNHFLLQGWFVAERTKFSLYAALPLVMAFLFDWEEKRRSTIKTAVFISLTLFFLNGEASFPLFGGLILAVFTFILFYFLRGFSFVRLWELGKLFGAILLISLPLNAYFLIPYGRFLLQSYTSQVSQFGGLGGILGWVDYISSNSSFSNILRLQGIPEWYLNNLHPYSSSFLNNPILIAISLLVAISAFLPLYLIRNSERRKKILFFAFLALLTMVFMAGSHRPFGALYVFLINYFPGFIAFRNPFYKFAPALWLSYAILIGFVIDYFLTKIEISKKLKEFKFNKILAPTLYIVVHLIIVLYSYPFLTGLFFDYILGERSTRITVPQYIFDFGKWSETPERISIRTLAIPPPNSENKVDSYTWGYWSLSPLTSLLTNAPVVNESNFMSNEEIRLVERLYSMIEKNEPGWQNFAKLLGIESFLLRRDFAWDLKTSLADSPQKYEEAMNDPDLKLVKKFGEWEVYDFVDNGIDKVNLTSNVNYLLGEGTDIGKVVSLPEFKYQEPIYISAIQSDNPEQILEQRKILYLIPFCTSCNLQHKFINIELFRPLITRDSILFPIIEFRDKLREEKLISTTEKVNYFLYKSLRSVLALDKFVIQRQGSGILKDEILDYGITLGKIREPLNSYLSTVQAIDNNFLLEIADVLRIEKTIILRNSSDISDREVLDALNQQYLLLEEIKGKVDDVIWRTTDEINKKYLVVSNADLEFDFLYRPNYQNSTLSATVKFTLDDRVQEVTPSFLSSEWYNLGKLLLSEGTHKLSIEQDRENLYGGSTEINLVSSSASSCLLSNKISGNKGDIYRISFQHRRLSGSKRFFVKILPGNEEPNPLDTTGDILNPSSVWDNYSAEYLMGDLESFYLTICNPPLPDEEEFSSSIEIRNMNIRKIIVPDVILYHSYSKEDSKENSSFKKISQTEYAVSLNTTEKQVLTLDESYNENWILDGKKKYNKFSVNGYANGWIIDGGAQNLSIKYRLQDLVRLGFTISGIAFTVSVLYLFLFRRK